MCLKIICIILLFGTVSVTSQINGPKTMNRVMWVAFVFSVLPILIFIENIFSNSWYVLNFYFLCVPLVLFYTIYLIFLVMLSGKCIINIIILYLWKKC